MYDLNRQSKPSLCSFSPQSLCTYIPSSHTLLSTQFKPHHYHNDTHLTELIETISRQLFYYSSSILKTNSVQEQANVQNILLENIKKILLFNLDKHGLIMEQKLLYLIVSLLHSKHNQINNLREFLMEVHFILTSHLWSNPNEQLPASLTMLLNGQFQELLHYVKQSYTTFEDKSILQSLIDMLVYKIQSAECLTLNLQPNITRTYIDKILTQVEKSNWLKILMSEIKKKDVNIKVQVNHQKQTLSLTTEKKTTQIYSLFYSKHQIQILLAILCGDKDIIEEVSKGSWGIYLNLYINFVQTLLSTTHKKQSYETVLRAYTAKYFQSKKSKKSTQEQEQIFLIKLLNTFSPQNRFSFHQIYQSSFNIFSPIISNIIGLLLIQFKVMDTYSIISNKEYQEDILLSLIENCKKMGWSALVYMIGYVQNSGVFKDYQGKESMWENLMFQYLPYEIEPNSSESSVQGQIKEIEQKVQDLNLIGLSLFTRSYLNTLFELQLNQSNTKLNERILEVFFLCLQMSDSTNANHCFHLMKKFISQYYRLSHFDYNLMDTLEGIFERKGAILNGKMEHKIEKLFSLIYKIQRIYEIANIECQNDQKTQRHVVLRQVMEFNKMFVSNKQKKPLSLCVQLLRLSAYLHSRIQNILNIGADHFPSLQVENQDIQDNQQMQEQLQPKNINQSETQLNTVREFEWNTHNYLNQWKASQETTQQPLSQQALSQLDYFDQYFY